VNDNTNMPGEESEIKVADASEELPSGVSILEVEGKRIFLVGTAHVSKESLKDVRKTIELVKPDTVCLELDQERYRNLTDPQRWKNTNIGKVIREGRAALLLSSLIMSSFQRRIGKKLGIAPGAEMAEGAKVGEDQGVRVHLIDRAV